MSVLYKNIVTYGFHEILHGGAHGVVFLRCSDADPPDVRITEGRLRVGVHDLALNRRWRCPPTW